MLEPRRGPGLRARLTLLATGLAAVLAGVLLWLAWLLVGNVVSAVPQLPPGTRVVVEGVPVAAERLDEVLAEAAREQVLVAGSIAFGLVVATTALLSWVLSGHVLRPLAEVTATARTLSAESLNRRLHLSGPRDEVADLADTLDGMLDRLQAAFETQRRFVANASHELRTPLAVVRTEIDVTVGDPDADVTELRRMAGVVYDGVLRAQQLVDGLLLLARTEGADLRTRSTVDLADLARTALSTVEADARARGLRISLPAEAAEAAEVTGDPALLERVVANLVENAVRHNVEAGWVQLCTSAGDGAASVQVSSSGEQLDGQAVDELFEPFHRGHRARTGREGAGLGLSVVQAVVTAHGGRVRAEPVAGGGLSVTVTLPAPR